MWAGEQSPLLYQKHPPPLAVPRNERTWSARCLFLEMLPSPLPKSTQQGTRGSCPNRKRVQNQQAQVAAVLAGNLGDSVGWSPLSLPETLLLFIHSNACSWRTLSLDLDYSAAPHGQPDSDFSDCHFLLFPPVPHPGFPAISPLKSHSRSS